MFVFVSVKNGFLLVKDKQALHCIEVEKLLEALLLKHCGGEISKVNCHRKSQKILHFHCVGETWRRERKTTNSDFSKSH